MFNRSLAQTFNPFNTVNSAGLQVCEFTFVHLTGTSPKRNLIDSDIGFYDIIDEHRFPQTYPLENLTWGTIIKNAKNNFLVVAHCDICRIAVADGFDSEWSNYWKDARYKDERH